MRGDFRLHRWARWRPGSTIPLWKPSADPPVCEYRECVLAGFEEGYRLRMHPTARSELRSAILSFRGTTRRFLVRPTRTYAIIARRATAPDALKDPDKRRQILDTLRTGFGEDSPPCVDAIGQAEVDALEIGDIPRFTLAVDCLDLRLDGGFCVRDVVGCTGIEAALERLGASSEEDLQVQHQLIDASFEARFPCEQSPRVAGYGDLSDESVASSEVLEAGERIVDEVVQSALCFGGRDWLTIGVATEAGHRRPVRVGPDLYGGSLGVALFLASSGELLGNDVVRAAGCDLSRRLVESVTGLNAKGLGDYAQVWGYGLAGLGGVLRACQFLTDVVQDDHHDWVGSANVIAKSITKIEGNYVNNGDFLRGFAGLVRPLCWLVERGDSPAAFTALEFVAQVLLKLAIGTAPHRASGEDHTLGLAHGMSGIASATVAAGAMLQDQSLIDAGARGLRSVATHFDAVHQDWPDYRGGRHATPRFAISWCAGAPGIALAYHVAKTAAPASADADDYMRAIEIGAARTAEGQLPASDNVCCGTAGRAAALLMLGAELERPDWSMAGQQLVNAIVRSSRDQAGHRIQIVSRNRVMTYDPSLMRGLAGLGMTLLHANDPRWVRILLL